MLLFYAEGVTRFDERLFRGALGPRSGSVPAPFRRPAPTPVPAPALHPRPL
jgi:hypothetical protein